MLLEFFSFQKKRNRLEDGTEEAGSAGGKVLHFCSCRQRTGRAYFLLKLRSRSRSDLSSGGAQEARGASGADFPGTPRGRALRVRAPHLTGRSPLSRRAVLCERAEESLVPVGAGRDHAQGLCGEERRHARVGEAAQHPAGSKGSTGIWLTLPERKWLLGGRRGPAGAGEAEPRFPSPPSRVGRAHLGAPVAPALPGASGWELRRLARAVGEAGLRAGSPSPSRRSPSERPAQPASPAPRLRPGPGRRGGGLGLPRTRSGDGEAMLECDWREPSGGDSGWDLSLLTRERDWSRRR